MWEKCSFIHQIWPLVFTLYLSNLLVLLWLSYHLKVTSFELLSVIYNYNIFGKITILLFFFNLIGVPLTPGFFLKLYLFSNILIQTNSIVITLIFIQINFIFFYFYLKSLKVTTKLISNKVLCISTATNNYITLYICVNIFFLFSWFFLLLI